MPVCLLMRDREGVDSNGSEGREIFPMGIGGGGIIIKYILCEEYIFKEKKKKSKEMKSVPLRSCTLTNISKDTGFKFLLQEKSG